MKIEVFNAVGGAGFFEGLQREWRADGDIVRPVFAVTDEEYRAQSARWARLRVRWRMYAGYAWQCWARPAEAADVRLVTTNPFFAPALVAAAAQRRGGRVPTVNLLFDLFPEALVQTGRIAANSWLARRSAAITRRALRESAATVFLGDRLRAYTESVHGAARRSVVIPVGADGTGFEASPVAIPGGEPVRVLYAGLMGRMHETATVLGAWRAGGSADHVRWAFHASGSGYQRLQQQAAGRSGVAWGGPLADAAWREAMRRAQVALVTIAPGAEHVVMPSKTYSALVAGQAVLAICRRESDLADLVARHDCGWVVEPGDVDGLLAVLAGWRTAPAELERKRRNAHEAGHRFYHVGPVARQWRELFQDLVAPAAVESRISSSHEALV